MEATEVDGVADRPKPSRAWLGLLRAGRPKYWALGLILGLGRLLSALPHPALLACGRGLGRLLYLFAGGIRRVATTNIGLCYPDLTGAQRKQRVRASFVELGISLYETLFVWFQDMAAFYRERVEVEGLEHWRTAMQHDGGVILLSCHYGCLDMNATLASFLDRGDRAMCFTYRAPSDDVVNRFLLDVRVTHADRYFPVDNLMGIVRALKRKGLVWYAPDIETRNKNTTFADFLGVPASTTVAIGKLAAAANAVVLPFAHYRKDDGTGYRLQIMPPLDSFPSGDEAADTRRVNAAIEQIIAPHPERYWWVIKRFKHLPDGSKRRY